MADIGIRFLAETDAFKALAAVEGIEPLEYARRWYERLQPAGSPTIDPEALRHGTPEPDGQRGG